jgi:hypothetical protein
MMSARLHFMPRANGAHAYIVDLIGLSGSFAPCARGCAKKRCKRVEKVNEINRLHVCSVCTPIGVDRCRAHAPLLRGHLPIRGGEGSSRNHSHMEEGSMVKEVKPGTRVRLKVPTFAGWKGMGTVVRVYGDSVTLMKDGYPLTGWNGTADVCRDEVAVLRDQSPPGSEYVLTETVKRFYRVEGIVMTVKGLYIPDKRMSPVERALRERDQAEMFTPESLRQFEVCRRFPDRGPEPL